MGLNPAPNNSQSHPTLPNQDAAASVGAGEEDEAKPPSKAAIAARCRRFCEVKARGRLLVPEWLHNKYKATPSEMHKIFEEVGCDKDLYVCKLHLMFLYTA